MAICDANLVDSMPTRLTAYGGLDALVHAMESYVSVCATDYTKGEQQRRVCVAVACLIHR
jgi:acetaldehyde dehydrogenase/alcohol dehydrogenase